MASRIRTSATEQACHGEVVAAVDPGGPGEDHGAVAAQRERGDPGARERAAEQPAAPNERSRRPSPRSRRTAAPRPVAPPPSTSRPRASRRIAAIRSERPRGSTRRFTPARPKRTVRPPVRRQARDGRVLAAAQAARGPGQQQPPAALEGDRRGTAAAEAPRRRRDAGDAVAVEARVEGARGGQPCGEEGGAGRARRARPTPPARSCRRAARARRARARRGRRRSESTAPPVPKPGSGEPSASSRITSTARRDPVRDRAGEHELALGLQRHRLELRARRPDDGDAVGAEVRVEVAARLQPRDREAIGAAEPDRARDEDAPVTEQRDRARCGAAWSRRSARRSGRRCRRSERSRPPGRAEPRDEEAAAVAARHDLRPSPCRATAAPLRSAPARPSSASPPSAKRGSGSPGRASAPAGRASASRRAMISARGIAGSTRAHAESSGPPASWAQRASEPAFG